MTIDAPSFLLFLGRFHILLLHLPIGVLVVVCLLELDTCVRRRIAGPPDRVGFLLLFGASLAVITAVLGLLLARDPLYNPEALFWHKWTGIAAAVAAVLAAWWRRFRSRQGRMAYWTCLSLTMICLGVAAHQGGVLTHGREFLTRYFPAAATTRGTTVPDVGDPAAPPGHAGVQRVLAAHCLACHAGEEPSGGLRLERKAQILAGGRSGKVAMVPGEALSSEMVRRILLPRDDLDVMPPASKPAMSPDAIMTIVDWINAGAEWPAEP